jgi:hypothetical protein
MHLKEILTAFTIDIVMLAGMALPVLITGPRFKKSPDGWMRSWILGAVSGIFMVLLAIWYLGTETPSGYRGFRSPAFRWGMGGYGLIGGVFAVLMGTFATDAARTTSEARTSFLVVSIATLLLLLALGTPFAHLLTWPKSPWLRMLIAPVSLVLLVAALSPLARAATWIALRFAASAKEKSL